MSIPGVTANAQLLLGFVAGALSTADRPDGWYRIADVDTAAGQITIERVATGNVFRVSIEQIDGSEFAL
jgi:hypothetical protein